MGTCPEGGTAPLHRGTFSGHVTRPLKTAETQGTAPKHNVWPQPGVQTGEREAQGGRRGAKPLQAPSTPQGGASRRPGLPELIRGLGEPCQRVHVTSSQVMLKLLVSGSYL